MEDHGPVLFRDGVGNVSLTDREFVFPGGDHMRRVPFKKIFRVILCESALFLVFTKKQEETFRMSYGDDPDTLPEEKQAYPFHVEVAEELLLAEYLKENGFTPHPCHITAPVAVFAFKPPGAPHDADWDVKTPMLYGGEKRATSLVGPYISLGTFIIFTLIATYVWLTTGNEGAKMIMIAFVVLAVLVGVAIIRSKSDRRQ